MISSPRINGYTDHSLKQNEKMPYDDSKYYTPTKTRPEWMRIMYSTPPLPSTPPPSPSCWQSPKYQSQLQYSPIKSPSLSYWQTQYLQRQNSPVLASSPGCHAGQYNQGQNIPMSPPTAGCYAGQYNQHSNTASSGYQHYGLCDAYHNFMIQPSSVAYQHNLPCLQQQSALASSTNPSYYTSYAREYAGTQIPGMTSSYWSTQQYPYQYQDPVPPASAGCVYSSQYPFQCQSTPEKPVDSPAQYAPEVNILITPVSSVQDLDKIIQDFETGYSSPQKKDNVSPVGTGKFVKKMVAALEQKYSAQASKSFPETKSRYNYSKDSKNSSTQKSFSDTFTSTKSAEKSSPASPAVNNQQQMPTSDGLNDTFILEDDYNFEIKVETKAPFVPEPEPDPNPEPEPEPEPEPQSEPEPEPEPQHADQVQEIIPTYTNTEVILRRKRISEASNILDSFEKMSSAPKIVGAKLKKPIEVDEDTAIEWIPVKNQKLPRKNSFKKLLSLLTGKKKQIKGSKFFWNLNKSNTETKSQQRDSGFVEKSSSSSSSLSSQESTKIQFTQQPTHEDSRFQTKQHSSLSTFQNPCENHIGNWLEHPSEENNNNNNNNMITDDKLINKNRMVLEEIDRVDVRLSLGPFYPIQSKNIFTDIKKKLKENAMKSSNPTNASKKSKDLINSSLMSSFNSPPSSQSPSASRIFKSPFSSPKKNSPRNSQVEQELNNSYRSFELPSPIWEFPSSHSNTYEHPKADWSQSEPYIFANTQNEIHRTTASDYDDIVYDIPRSHTPRRPKSSIYEDALSMKRRTESFDSRATTATSNFGAQEDEDLNFATIRSRPRVSSSQQILKSMAQDDKNQLRAPFLVNSLRL